MAWFFVCALLLAAGALVFIKNVSELAVDVAFVIVAGILGFGIPAIWQIVNGAIEQKEEDKRKGQDEEVAEHGDLFQDFHCSPPSMPGIISKRKKWSTPRPRRWRTGRISATMIPVRP